MAISCLFSKGKMYRSVSTILWFKEVIKISNKLNRISIVSNNGEIHFICRECYKPEWLIEDKEFNEQEAKRMSKLEASKPLLLLRE